MPTLPITWIVKGDKKIEKKLRRLSRIDKDIKFAARRTAKKAKSIWKNIAYKHYNVRVSHGLEVSGQLGKGLRVFVGKKRISFRLAPLLAERRSGTFDYSKVLKYGARPSPGAYVWKLDRRVRTGWHGGTPDNPKRWKGLKDELRAETTTHFRKVLRRRVRRIIRG